MGVWEEDHLAFSGAHETLQLPRLGSAAQQARAAVAFPAEPTFFLSLQ